MVQLLFRSKTCPKQVSKGLKYKVDNTLGSKECFDLDLWTCDLNINMDHLIIGHNPCTKLGIDQVKGSTDIGRTTTQWAKKSGLTLTFDHVKINRDHLLNEGNLCTKFGIDQVKGSKDIERTTQSVEKRGLTLTFDHVTWKSIGIIYSLRITPAANLVLIKWRGQKILIGQHLVYRPTDRPTDRQLQNHMPPFSRKGIKIIRMSCTYVHLHVMYYITTKFHEILLSGFRGVALTKKTTERLTGWRTDWLTDRLRAKTLYPPWLVACRIKMRYMK